MHKPEGCCYPDCFSCPLPDCEYDEEDRIKDEVAEKVRIRRLRTHGREVIVSRMRRIKNRINAANGNCSKRKYRKRSKEVK